MCPYGSIRSLERSTRLSCLIEVMCVYVPTQMSEVEHQSYLGDRLSLPPAWRILSGEVSGKGGGQFTHYSAGMLFSGLPTLICAA